MLQELLSATFKDRKTNAWVRADVERRAQSGPIKSISYLARTRKMRWFGHITRHPEQHPLTSTIIHRTTRGSRGRGRPRWTWHDDMKERTGRSRAAGVTNAAKDRNMWRTLSSAPTDPPGLWRNNTTWCRGVLISLATAETPIVREAAGNHLIKIHFLRNKCSKP